jgi:hypothetical protein
MIQPLNQKLLVPIELLEFVYENKLFKSLTIFLLLKIYIGDKVCSNSEVFPFIKENFKMKDSKDRTFNKHFQRLLEMNWIGYNKKNKIYHIRSFKFLKELYQFRKKRSSEVYLKDIKQIQIYIVGVILCKAIYDQKYYWEKVKRLRSATNYKGVANQAKTFCLPLKPNYYGLSNTKIAALLNCNYTRASVLKNAAFKLGYIHLFHHYEDVIELDKPDYYIRPKISLSQPQLAKRLRFWSKIRNGKRVVLIVRQLHDEILPNIPFKRRNYTL